VLENRTDEVARRLAPNVTTAPVERVGSGYLINRCLRKVVLGLKEVSLSYLTFIPSWSLFCPDAILPAARLREGGR
jgi:hypothetical protein